MLGDYHLSLTLITFMYGFPVPTITGVPVSKPRPQVVVNVLIMKVEKMDQMGPSVLSVLTFTIQRQKMKNFNLKSRNC